MSKHLLNKVIFLKPNGMKYLTLYNQKPLKIPNKVI